MWSTVHIQRTDASGVEGMQVRFIYSLGAASREAYSETDRHIESEKNVNRDS